MAANLFHLNDAALRAIFEYTSNYDLAQLSQMNARFADIAGNVFAQRVGADGLLYENYAPEFLEILQTFHLQMQHVTILEFSAIGTLEGLQDLGDLCVFIMQPNLLQHITDFYVTMEGFDPNVHQFENDLMDTVLIATVDSGKPIQRLYLDFDWSQGEASMLISIYLIANRMQPLVNQNRMVHMYCIRTTMDNATRNNLTNLNTSPLNPQVRFHLVDHF